MKNLIILFIVAIGAFIWLQPSKLPAHNLTVFPNNKLSPTKLVGGPCLKEKCLTVYVAPWCPVCTHLRPMILSLVNDMESNGVPVTLIVGKDKVQNVTNYAANFPFPVYLDAEGQFYKNAHIKSIPYFAVTNREGEITNFSNGGYENVNIMKRQLGF